MAGTLLDSPVWNLAKKVMHYDPLRGVKVEPPTVEILGDFLRLVGEEERLAQMEERGTLQETADWLDTQFAIWIGLIGELIAIFSDAWAAIQPENLPDLLANVAALAARVVGLVQSVVLFEATIIAKVLELVKYALLGWLSEYAHLVPGFHLLTVIVGQNPFTGEIVALTAENLINGFITLMPGGEAMYDELAESGVIAAAAGRIEAAIADLGISVEFVTATFLGIWNTLTPRRPARSDRRVRPHPRAVRGAAAAARAVRRRRHRGRPRAGPAADELPVRAAGQHHRQRRVGDRRHLAATPSASS